MLDDIRRDVVAGIIDASIPPNSMEEQWDIAELEARLAAEFTVQLPVQQWLDEEKTLDEAGLRERIITAVDEAYRTKIAPFGADMRRLEKQIMLQVLDNLWKEHLATMDHLRQGIHLRSYAQKNPKQEYKREAFRLFEDLLNNLKYEVIRFLSHVEIRRQDEAEELERQRREAEARQKIQFQHAEASAFGEEAEEGVDADNPSATPFVREAPKVGRNDPCPCGSGKKYKQCHGALS
jgi:preprotein translocase subunit SecA